jgi:transposase InsO family protein
MVCRGSPNSTTVRRRGERVNHKRVPRVMPSAGIAGYRRRRRVKTTQLDPVSQKLPDLLDRGFTAEPVNTRYVGDITYLPPATGANLYFATVIDCCSRRVTGWAGAEHMRTEFVDDVLHAAAAVRGSLVGAVFHSDHGSQYTSRHFAALCKELGVTQLVGGMRSSSDNALAESFNATLKREVLQDRSHWPDAATCRREVFRWLARYNTKRRHSRCRHSSPATYERTMTTATLPVVAPGHNDILPARPSGQANSDVTYSCGRRLTDTARNAAATPGFGSPASTTDTIR